MIILDDKYAIVSGDNSVNLAVKNIDKNGKENYITQTYHNTVLSAVQYYIKIKQRERISKKTYKSLSEAVEDLKKLDAEIRKQIDI